MGSQMKRRREIYDRGPPRQGTETMPMQEQQIVEQVRDTIQRWVDGKVDAKTFEDFLKTSNAKLDEIKAAKGAENERWWKVSTRFIEC
jgi:hypothetical protein